MLAAAALLGSPPECDGWCKNKKVTKTTYLDRSLQLKQDWLRNEDFTSLCAQEADFLFEQLHLLAGPGAAHLQQSVYDGVEIDVVFASHGGTVVERSDSRRGGEERS